ncbi:unnamed protein product [Mytilus edulis]|uniref:B box-type domain-containing protein n=1 Tax=Mytilus edulis TaxID=6550 RepID=A0A8S3Q5V3_MYTED|nr:unnamed protein product [Mytilus edulis]
MDRMSILTITKDIPSNVKIKDGKVICTEHGQQEVGMYCKKCGVLVCTGCIEFRHRSHEIVSVKSQAVEDRKLLLRTIPGLKQTFIPSLKDNLKSIKESRDSTKAEFSKLIEQINARSLELIKEIHKVRDRMIQECKANQEKTTTFLNETESKTLNGISTLEKSMKYCEELLRQERADRNAEIILERIDLDSNLDEFPNKSPKLGYPNFHPGLNDENVLKHMFGGFRGQFKRDFDAVIPYTKLTAITKKLKPNIVAAFKYKTDIRAMCIVDVNTAWLVPISQYNELVKVDRSGRELERRSTGFQVYDFTLTKNQDILATNSENKSLIQLTDDGGHKEVADLPLRPRGLSAYVELELQEQIIPAKIQKKHSFRDVCCDSLGNIIISDEKYNEIVVLTKHGGKKCLLTHRLQRTGGLNINPHFYRPSCLGLDGDGKLWVLQKQGITVVDLYSQWMPGYSRQPLTSNTPR